MNKEIEKQRMRLWADVYTVKIKTFYPTITILAANQALAAFDKRFKVDIEFDDVIGNAKPH